MIPGCNFRLMLILIKTAACVDQVCWFSQARRCDVSLGDKLHLQMVPNAHNRYDLIIHKRINNTQHDPVCRVKNEKIRECDLYRNRPEVTVVNGTLVINPVTEADLGNYRLRLNNPDGSETSTDLRVSVKGLDRFCWFRQSDLCHAALGHQLSLMLMLDTLKHDLRLQKRRNDTYDDPICRVRHGRIKENQCDLYNHRPQVIFDNGMLVIKPVTRADSGNYRLQIYDSDGSETSTDFQVNVEAPIGSVLVSVICSSNGVMRASCFSDGDPMSYSWTLNGHEVMKGNSSIELDEGTEGNISCSVKNNISHKEKTVRFVCPTVSSVWFVVFVPLWCFQMMVLLGLLGGFYIYMRHTAGKKQEDQNLKIRRHKNTRIHETSSRSSVLNGF